MVKHLVQALPQVLTLQCLTGKADKNNNDINHHSTNESHNDYFITNGNQQEPTIDLSMVDHSLDGLLITCVGTSKQW